MHIRTSNLDMEMSEGIHNEALILIEDMCLMLNNKVLTQLWMTSPNRLMHHAFNHESKRKIQYDYEALSGTVQSSSVE